MAGKVNTASSPVDLQEQIKILPQWQNNNFGIYLAIYIFIYYKFNF